MKPEETKAEECRVLLWAGILGVVGCAVFAYFRWFY